MARILQHRTLCGIRPRAWTSLVQAEPIVVRYHYPCGYTHDVVAAQDTSLSKIAPVLLRRWAAGYWSKENNNTGITHECPRCRRAALKAARRLPKR